MESTPGRQKIWIAENDDEFRDLVALVLRRRDLDVQEFASGRQILDATASEGLPDVLVTDHHMPELNGLDAVEQLRQSGAGIPVVLVTAFADSGVKERAARLGVVVVEKPCDVYNLRQVILDQVPAPPSSGA